MKRLTVFAALIMMLSLASAQVDMPIIQPIPGTTCFDGWNDHETDSLFPNVRQDCGGFFCPPCPDGLFCYQNSDCQSNCCIGSNLTNLLNQGMTLDQVYATADAFNIAFSLANGGQCQPTAFCQPPTPGNPPTNIQPLVQLPSATSSLDATKYNADVDKVIGLVAEAMPESTSLPQLRANASNLKYYVSRGDWGNAASEAGGIEAIIEGQALKYFLTTDKSIMWALEYFKFSNIVFEALEDIRARTQIQNYYAGLGNNVLFIKEGRFGEYLFWAKNYARIASSNGVPQSNLPYIFSKEVKDKVTAAFIYLWDYFGCTSVVLEPNNFPGAVDLPLGAPPQPRLFLTMNEVLNPANVTAPTPFNQYCDPYMFFMVMYLADYTTGANYGGQAVQNLGLYQKDFGEPLPVNTSFNCVGGAGAISCNEWIYMIDFKPSYGGANLEVEAGPVDYVQIANLPVGQSQSVDFVYDVPENEALPFGNIVPLFIASSSGAVSAILTVSETIPLGIGIDETAEYAICVKSNGLYFRDQCASTILLPDPVPVPEPCPYPLPPDCGTTDIPPDYLFSDLLYKMMCVNPYCTDADTCYDLFFLSQYYPAPPPAPPEPVDVPVPTPPPIGSASTAADEAGEPEAIYLQVPTSSAAAVPATVSALPFTLPIASLPSSRIAFTSFWNLLCSGVTTWGPVCGNTLCEAGETALNCPSDCASTQAICGNNSCQPGETTLNCPTDCFCGDQVCDSTESTATCAVDCPIGTTPNQVCGDNVCTSGETTANCPGDCPAGTPAPVPVPIGTPLGGLPFQPGNLLTTAGVQGAVGGILQNNDRENTSIVPFEIDPSLLIMETKLAALVFNSQGMVGLPAIDLDTYLKLNSFNKLLNNPNLTSNNYGEDAKAVASSMGRLYPEEFKRVIVSCNTAEDCRKDLTYLEWDCVENKCVYQAPKAE